MGNCSGSEGAQSKVKGINIRDDKTGRASINGKARVSECKVVMLGQGAVGKTSIALRYLKDEFSDLHKVTIGAQFQQPLIKLKSGNTLKLNLWDTTGDEKFGSMLQMYFRDSKGAIIVYDIGDRTTFDKVGSWLNTLCEYVKKEDAIMYLVGNKKDIEPRLRQVETDVAQTYAKNNQMLFAEVSAKTGDGINDLFKNLAEELAKKFKY